jgi:hypothetical protein
MNKMSHLNDSDASRVVHVWYRSYRIREPCIEIEGSRAADGLKLQRRSRTKIREEEG